MNTRRFLATCLAVAATAASAFGSATPGVVGTDFASAKTMAEKQNIPLAVIWGNTSCSYCGKLATAVKTSTVTGWVSEHKILLVHKHEAYGSKASDYVAAEEWIDSLGKNGNYPKVGFYWKKSDGTEVKKAFAGRSGKMPGTVTSGALEKQFVSALETVFKGYNGAGSDSGDDDDDSGDVTPATGDSADASFVMGTSATDRLEADSNTEVVYVPLTRATTTKAASSLLVAKALGMTTKTYSVSWKAGEDRVNVAVEMPAKVTAGRKMTLTLQDTDGSTRATSSITFVKDVANSPLNPHWVGDYTAKTLPYGEWTMDFDVAKAKVATYGGKILAMFAGPLWCPNCEAMDTDVLASSKFQKWAKSEKLVLVIFDQGEASGPSTPEGTARGRLLTFTPSTDGVSGASYLSRHGIDSLSDDVADVIDRVTELTDAWLPPESTAARLSNPCVLLLDDAGTGVDARFVRQAEGHTMDLNENLSRFKDLLTLAGDDETECYRTTTPLALAAGESTTAEFHINRRTTVWALDGLSLDEYFAATVTSDDRSAQDVYLSLVDEDGKTLASGRNRLVLEEPLSSVASSTEGLYLDATSFGSTSTVARATFYGSKTSFAAKVSVNCSEGEPQVMEEFSSLTKAELKAANENLCAKKSATIPVYETLLGGKTLAGALTVSLSTANRISAKFVGATTLSFSGTWQEINTASGKVYATLAKGGSALDLEMDADGVISAVIDGVGEGEARTDAAKSFAGAYTVTLVPVDETEGIGTLAIKVTGAGKATVSGTVGAGVAVSASGTLSLNSDDTATLPVFVNKRSYGTLALALRFAPNASATWGSAGSMSTVTAEPDCAALWTVDGENETFDVYGGYWKNGATPKTACDDFEMPAEMTVSIGGEEVADVTAAGKGFTYEKGVFKSLSLSRTTGVLTGKKTVTVNGKSVTATIKGVVMPGWYDCGCESEPVFERPFAAGMMTYKANGQTVTESIVFEIKK